MLCLQGQKSHGADQSQPQFDVCWAYDQVYSLGWSVRPVQLLREKNCTESTRFKPVPNTSSVLALYRSIHSCVCLV